MTEFSLKTIELNVDGESRFLTPADFGIDEPLPYGHDHYFNLPEGTAIIALSDLRPSRARDTGVANAFRYMKEAREGFKAKRNPISVIVCDGGKFVVADGNSTFVNAVIADWPDIPCFIVKPAPSRLRFQTLHYDSMETTRSLEAT